MLMNATIPTAMLSGSAGLPPVGDGLVRGDIHIAGGKIRAVTPPTREAPLDSHFDMDGGMVWPCLVDCHTHLDKGHTWRRSRNPDGTFQAALDTADADIKSHWSPDDLRVRMDFALRCAMAHGTGAIRTHLDVIPERPAESWEVFRAVQADWRGRIDLQAASLAGLEFVEDERLLGAVTAEVKQTRGGLLGAFLYAMPDLDERLDRFLRHAGRHGLDVDFHADETTDATSRCTSAIAEAVLRTGYEGRVLVGHAVAPSLRDDDDLDRLLDLVAAAGLSIVTLPQCNAYLLGRSPGRTPRLRAVAPIHEMRARGIAVAIASDNTRDPFHMTGDLDLLDVFRSAVRLQHLDHPFGGWPAAIAATPAALMGLDAGVLRPGAAADLVLFGARDWSELLSRPQHDRIILRKGRAVTADLPDYRELDHLKGLGHDQT
jgi:cytosine deaminase